MKRLVYCVEVGVLLKQDNEEFDYYTIKGFFDDYCAFYDENRVLFFDYEKALNYAKKYVENGVVNTYAVVHYDIFNFSDDDIKNIEEYGYADDYIFNPTIETTNFYTIKNEKNEIEILIDKGEQSYE